MIFCSDLCHLFWGINVDSWKTLESVDWDEGDKSVQFLSWVLVFVTLAVKANTDTVLDVTDSTLPNGFVQTGVDADVFKMNLKPLFQPNGSFLPSVPMALRAKARMASMAFGARYLKPMRWMRWKKAWSVKFESISQFWLKEKDSRYDHSCSRLVTLLCASWWCTRGIRHPW